MSIKKVLINVVAGCLMYWLNPIPANAQSFETINEKALKFLNYLADSNFAAANNMLDSSTRVYLNDFTLQRDWIELTGNYGTLVSKKPIEFQQQSGYTFVQYLLKLELLQYVLSLTFNPELKIGYVQFAPAHQVYHIPNYADITKYRDTTVTFKTTDIFEFKGILSLPNTQKKVPLIFIVGDAGPTDKDFSMKDNKPYRDLASGLATAGYAVYRFDKRAYLYGIYLAADKNNYKPFTPKEDYLDDLYAAMEEVKKLPYFDLNRIYILGHGQGGNLAPYIAKERKDIKGIMMLGANAVSQQEMMAEQYDYLADVLYEKRHEYLENKRKIANTLPGKVRWFDRHDSMPYGIQASYFVWLNNYNHLETAKKLQKPILIMHFERDYQVSNRNFDLWKQTLKKHKQATFKSYKKLNHLMYEGEGPSTYSDYYIKANLPEYLIKDLADWLDK
ncbi:MAG: serine aminopeptidase domain-containing protein [Bacteroidia bacterium]